MKDIAKDIMSKALGAAKSGFEMGSEMVQGWWSHFKNRIQSFRKGNNQQPEL